MRSTGLVRAQRYAAGASCPRVFASLCGPLALEVVMTVSNIAPAAAYFPLLLGVRCHSSFHTGCCFAVGHRHLLLPGVQDLVTTRSLRRTALACLGDCRFPIVFGVARLRCAGLQH